jgi:hypothetical protein
VANFNKQLRPTSEYVGATYTVIKRLHPDMVGYRIIADEVAKELKLTQDDLCKTRPAGLGKIKNQHRDTQSKILFRLKRKGKIEWDFGTRRMSNYRLSPSTLPTREQITCRAYELYVQRGYVNGYDAQDWLQAEKELSGIG